MPEVLVVMMIIGILAAIGSGGFSCQKLKADDASSKVEARTAVAAMEAYAQDNLGAYDGATGTILNGIEESVPTGTTVTPHANCAGTEQGIPNVCYLVKSTPNSSTQNAFQFIKTADGRLLSDCDTNPSSAGNQHNEGGCPANGRWAAE